MRAIELFHLRRVRDKPRALAAYRPAELAADALGLIDAAGRQRAFVVGHDWGAMVAWWLALVAPQRLERLAILNVPHPHVARRHLTGDPGQQKRSLYAAFFHAMLVPCRIRSNDKIIYFQHDFIAIHNCISIFTFHNKT